MGENAKYHGEVIKIGTCENLYWLRASQRTLVTKAPNSLDANDPSIRGVLRFRFPWPDEDGDAPGSFENFDRADEVPGFEVPEGVVDHKSSCPRKAAQAICQQRYAVPPRCLLAVVCRCTGCGVRYRLPTFEDALPLIDACRRNSLTHGCARPFWWNRVADRIEDGYRTDGDHFRNIHMDDGTYRAKLEAAAPTPAPTAGLGKLTPEQADKLTRSATVTLNLADEALRNADRTLTAAKEAKAAAQASYDAAVAFVRDQGVQ
jgi:hypothetical protein